jgi:hypothetical protein
MNITVTKIGCIDKNIDGNDEYVLLTRNDDDLTCDEAHDWLLPQVYRETQQEAGGYFCLDVEVLQRSTNSVVAIIRHRYDV